MPSTPRLTDCCAGTGADDAEDGFQRLAVEHSHRRDLLSSLERCGQYFDIGEAGRARAFKDKVQLDEIGMLTLLQVEWDLQAHPVVRTANLLIETARKSLAESRDSTPHLGVNARRRGARLDAKAISNHRLFDALQRHLEQPLHARRVGRDLQLAADPFGGL